MLRAELLTIGDEILIGQIVDTNAAWLGEKLTQAGVDVQRSVSLGDEDDAIRQALDDAFARADLVVTTGGLGATHDDLTRSAVAAYFGVPLLHDEAVMAAIAERHARRGRTMPEQNRLQALVPQGFAVLPNARGTAPGLWYTFSRDGADKTLVVLPGVPGEMRELFQQQVLPRLARLHGLRVIRHKTLLTAGLGETHLSEAIGDLTDWLGPSLRLAFLPSTRGVRLRMTALAPDAERAEVRLAAFETFLQSKVGRYIYGENDETLEGKVGEMLAAHGLTVAVAESCTGGFLLDALTNPPGASRYVKGGVVAYCNEVKMSQLGVPPADLERDGAVSESVARAMAEGVRTRLGADMALSTTGVAGPGGGTPEKPVGLVWIGLSSSESTRAYRYRFVDDRIMNKELTCTAALDLLRRHLLRRDED